jgi:hypothetical protein
MRSTRGSASENDSLSRRIHRYHVAALALVLGAALVAVGAPLFSAQDQAPSLEPNGSYARLNSGQLNRLVAPVALYPDALVAQVLSASTFPSQIVEADEWVKSHSSLSAMELGQQADQQPWDPSVKALVQYPSVLANLAANLGWTSELGDAYYNQSEQVMKAVQEMRKKAQKAGNLKPSPQLSVSDQGGDVEIAPSDPNTVFVPAYDPWLIYGAPLDPWPYWVDVPGIWWGGPGLYFGIGFPVAPFVGFGWGWGAWGFDWRHYHPFFHGNPYFARGPAFFDRGGFYGGRRDFAAPRNIRPMLNPRGSYRGFEAPRPQGGMRGGAFSGFGAGGATRGFSARGQTSFGGARGGFGGGFHGGGGRR